MDWHGLIPLTAGLLLLAPCLGVSLKCPNRVLKGGRVRIQSKGRVARYVCLKGYQVLGDKYSACIRGRWDTPVPVCINPGCLPLDVPNGEVLEKYRGAFVTVHCNPGYSLVGTQSLYCNGAVWNDTTPVCRGVKTDAQEWCDFESEDLCGWTHDRNHDFDWRRHNFATPSGHVGTGPSFDHTFGPGLNGHYMYIETSSPRLVNDTARLFSPVFSPRTDADSCFIFWYHMFGVSTGSLNVYLHSEDTSLLFSKSGDQGNFWHQAVVSLPEMSSSFQIVIEGVRGTSYEGDIAIDDVKIVEGEGCMSLFTTTIEPSYNTVDEASCENRCLKSMEDPSVCECTPDCIGNNTCCPDYLQMCLSDSTDPLVLTTSGNQESQWDEVSTSDISVSTTESSVSKPLLNTVLIFPSTSSETGFHSDLHNKSQVEGVFGNSVGSWNTSTLKVNNKSQLNVSETTFRDTITLTFPFTKTVSPMPSITEHEKMSNTVKSNTKLLYQTTTKPTMSTVNNTQITSTSNVVRATLLPITMIQNSSQTSTSKPLIQVPVTKKFAFFPSIFQITSKFERKPMFTSSTKNPWLPRVPSSKYKPELQFITPPPPVVFRTPAKNSYQQITKNLQNVSLDTFLLSTTTINPTFLKNPTQNAPKSKNDVLHPVWSKATVPPSVPSFIGFKPKLITHPTTKSHSITTKFSKLKNSGSISPTATEKKWKPKFKPRDEMPYHAAAVVTPSNHMVQIVILVCGLLLILTTVLTTVCVVRRRRISRRSIEDDELDIRFLASDEILDFTLARPNPDVCETAR